MAARPSLCARDFVFFIYVAAGGSFLGPAMWGSSPLFIIVATLMFSLGFWLIRRWIDAAEVEPESRSDPSSDVD